MALFVSTLVRPFTHFVQEKHCIFPFPVQLKRVLQYFVLYWLPGPDKGGYWHRLFFRGDQELARGIERINNKRIEPRKSNSQESRPSFYTVPLLPSSTTGQPRLAPVQPTCHQFDASVGFTSAGGRRDSPRRVRPTSF